MNSNKFVGAGLIFTIIFCFFIALFIETQATPEEVNNWYTVGGVFILLFNIWGGVKLLKS